MNDGTGLREAVLEALRGGKLPHRSPDGISGGLGAGGACAICDRIVDADELELQLEFTKGERPDCYTVHLACYSAWKAKRQELESNPAAMAATGLSGAVADIKFAADERQGPREQGEP
jgi:hypothetical protein